MTADDSGTDRLAQVRDYFGEGTPYLRPGYARRLRAEIVRDLVGPASGLRVLDAGCGDGSISTPTFLESGQLTLLDLSPAMLETARARLRERATGVRFIEGDLHAVDSDTDFDVVLLIGVLAHVPSVAETLDRIHELLAPGGRCVIQLTDHRRLLARLRWPLEVWASRRQGGRRYAMNRTTLDQLDRLAEKHGMRRTALVRYSWVLPGMGRLPDEWLYRIERFTYRCRWLGALGTTAIVRYDKPDR